MQRLKLGLVLCSMLVGATEVKCESIKLDETVINSSSFGTRIFETPKNVSVVTGDDIEKNGYQTVEDAIKSVPGVYFSNTGGKDHMPEVLLRGQTPGKASSNILVLLDGIPLNTIDTSGVNLSLIPIEDVSKIEVIPNGGNVLYGEGATAGIINITTKSKGYKKYYGYAGFDAGSYGRRNYRVNMGTNVTEKLSLDVSYNDKFLDGYRHHSEKGSKYFSAKGKYELEDGNINLSFIDSKIDSKFSGKVDKDDIKKANSKTEAKESLRIYRGGYVKNINKDLSIFLNGDYKERTYKSQTTDRDTKSHFIKPELKYSYYKDSYITLGGDYSKGESDYTSKSHNKNNFTTRESIGGFISNTTAIGDFILSQGYRKQKIDFDQVAKKGGNGKTIKEKFSSEAYEISGAYNYDLDTSIYLSYNHTFRAPTVSEAGSWKGDIGVQKSDIIELGTKTFVTDNIYLAGAVFNMKTNDEIFYLTSDSGEITGNYNFKDEIVRNGVELTAEQYFDNLTLRQNFSYIDHEIKDGKYSGKKVPGVPEYLANIGATYEFIENLNLTTTWYYYGPSYAQYDYENKYPQQGGHTEVNVNINYKVTPELLIYGGVDNLFDKEYFSAKAPTSKGKSISYYYGNRRSFYLGFNYTF